MPGTILIVDDEERVRASIRGVLADEGYRVLEADNGRAALELIEQEKPVLVLLDIWMPEVDGIDLLRRLRNHGDATKVIVISGHGNIETAVEATRLGAADFIEKPFSLDRLLDIVSRALGNERVGASAAGNGPVVSPRRGTRPDPTPTRPARTLAKSVVVAGHGLHSGVRTGLILNPAPPGTGVVFESLSDDVVIPALVEYVDTTGYATTLHHRGASAKTVEHLLATLHAFGITNLRVTMQGEIPILDGSALEFCRLVESGGLEEQSETVEEFVVDRTFDVVDEANGTSLRLEPADRFEIDYTLEYPAPVGVEHVVYCHEGPESFEREIAPARTFGFLKDIESLERMGLAGGGRLHNCILIGEDGPVNTELRIECEFARHKILDIMGDLFLFGRPIRGRVVARKTGHTDNIRLLRSVRAAEAA